MCWAVCDFETRNHGTYSRESATHGRSAGRRSAADQPRPIASVCGLKTCDPEASQVGSLPSIQVPTELEAVGTLSLYEGGARSKAVGPSFADGPMAAEAEDSSCRCSIAAMKASALSRKLIAGVR